ncbi:MAG: cobalamin-dependent protein [Candidatus Bathyarchaeia archaeon]|nr:cobalamin-dependent protein [Candidatus Bathyarchaeota archaeon]
MVRESGKIRVLLSKVGVDVHDRGLKVVASALRDAGMEVIYLGASRFQDEIVKAAEEEDVDIIGISSMEGMHHVKIPELMRELRRRGIHAPVVCGGIIPLNEAKELKEQHGVSEVFPPGSSLREIVEYFKKCAGSKTSSIPNQKLEQLK